VTAIIGTAGDRPDDSLRGIGRIAARMADRVVIKETLEYLRGRDRGAVVSLIADGIAEGGQDPASVPVHETEVEALAAELARDGGGATSDGQAAGPRVIVLFCHQERDAVFALLDRLGARQVDAATGRP
jgi:hypothetical protein